MSASKKTAGISTLHLLPQEILVEILSKLPAKSLVRFRCVSKFFCALIVDHGFAVLYRSLSLTLPSRAGILIAIKPRTPQSPPLFPARSPAYYTINSPQENERKLEANRVRFLDSEPLREGLLHSSSDGLICLSKRRGDVAVCNVSTGHRIPLPTIQSHSPFSTYAMLGFDSESKRYKVLMSAAIANPGNSSDERNCYEYKHWVLTVGVDKSWREINNNGSRPFFPLYGHGCPYYPKTSVYIGGVIYSYNWLTYDSRNNIPRSHLVAFEVGSESFSEITFPDEVSSHSTDRSGVLCHYLDLVEVDGGRLAIVLVRPDLCYMDAWTLEKSGEWDKTTVTIPLEESGNINGDKPILRFTTNPAAGEIVLLWVYTDSFSLLVCNLKTHVWRKFDVGGVEDFPIFTPWEVTMYNFVDNVFPLE